MVYETIMNYRENAGENRKKILTSVGNMCASACVYITSASDKIYTHRTSIIGSIGVKMEGFGFVDLMEQVGIERRSLTAGRHKTIMSPFEREDTLGLAEVKANVLLPTYQEFILAVERGRGELLDKSDPNLYSGLIWSGTNAIEKGLADEVETTYRLFSDLKKEYSVEDIHEYNPEATKDFFAQYLTGMFSTFADILVTKANEASNRIEMK